jgi:hypothetical protein
VNQYHRRIKKAELREKRLLQGPRKRRIGVYESLEGKENQGIQLVLPKLTLQMIKTLFSALSTRYGRAGIYRCDKTMKVYGLGKASSMDPYSGEISSIDYDELISGGMDRFYQWRDKLPKEIYTATHRVPKIRKKERLSDLLCHHGLSKDLWCSICQPN